MLFPRSISKLVLIVSIAVLLTACGGGGGGGEDDDPAPTTYAALSTNIYTGDTYTDVEVSVDANGDSIVRTKLTILFKPTATKMEVDALLARINATITASIAGARSVSIRIPDPVTVNDLEDVIADIQSEAFVEAVLKSVIDVPTVMPDNLNADIATDVAYIEHHAAVGGTAAWNAKEAVSSAPNVIIMDWFGSGVAILNSYLDASISGTVNGVDPDHHGYHVAGIIAGSFGGASVSAGGVTGMFPDRSNVYVIDRTADFNGQKLSGRDAMVQALLMAANIGGTVVMNTSLAKNCHSSTTSGTCRELIPAMQEGIMWADMVRAAALESRLAHMTAASNRDNPAPDMRDTETVHPFSTAATMLGMATTDGTFVPGLTNTMVVERLDGIGSPREVGCLNDNSFVGGNISAIGTNVASLDSNATARRMSGTSMAAPQVAGLAAYLLSIDDSLSPQRIKSILLDTSQAVPTTGGVNCSDATAAPAIDAYAAVLALDEASALNGNRSNAPVRNAILDIADGSAELGENGQFDEHDLTYYVEKIDAGSQEIKDGTETVKYSRADLNGDGYDGGRVGFEKKFNLDIDYPPTFSTVNQTIEDEEVEFDENSLTDNDILCYYAYSDLYTGDTTERTNLMENRCRSSNMAVYYSYNSFIGFPFSPTNTECGNSPQGVNEDDENVSLLADATDLLNRPDNHYWFSGDSYSYVAAYGVDTSRGTRNTQGDCVSNSFTGSAEVNATLEIPETGEDRLQVDITSLAASNCVDMTSTTGGQAWTCAQGTQGALWMAVFDLDFEIASNFNLILNFMCTGPNLSAPGYPDPTNPFLFAPMDISVVVGRINEDGNGVPSNRDFTKIIGPANYYCNDDFPVVNVQQLMEFDEPLSDGATDRVIITVTGNASANGNLGNAPSLNNPPIPVPTVVGETGLQTNITTMTGYVEVAPAN